MKPVPNVDPHLRVHSVFDAVFRMLFPLPEVCDLLGFRAVSERLQGAPGWFLWLAGRPGAFGLELVEAAHCAAGDADACVGTFILRYYPAQDDDILDLLSREEQAIRQGDLFDHTGTPTLDGLALIPEDMFRVGSLDVSLDLDGRGHGFRLHGPWPVETAVPDLPSLPWSGERRQEAWDLAWLLANRLLAAFSRHIKMGPAWAAVHGWDGGSRNLALTVLFGQRGLPSHASLGEPDGLLLCEAHGEAPLPGSSWLNPLWWLAPSLQFSTAVAEYAD